MPTVEQARETKAGPLLDAMFFEVCWPNLDVSHWYTINVKNLEFDQAYAPVSTDANACEAWAMRWAREKGLRYEIAECADKVRVRLYDWQGRDFGGADLWMAQEYGENFKEAFVRACVAAGEQLETNGETKQ